MLQNIHANKYFKTAIIFIIVVLLASIFFSLKLNIRSDDGFFADIIHQSKAIDYLYSRYITWTGRIPIEALLIFTINYSFFWKTVIPLCLLLLSMSISRIVCQKITLFYMLITLILLLLIPMSINRFAVFWVTGFYNYLLPIALATYVYSYIMNESNNRTEFILSCVATFIFSYTEQIGMFFLCLCFISLIIFKHTRTRKNNIIILLSIINYIVLVTAPGNYKRLIYETWTWFPSYVDYSFFQKICFGFDKLHQVFTLSLNFPLIIFIGLIGFCYIQQGIKTIAGTLSFGTIIVFSFFSILRWINKIIYLLNTKFFYKPELNWNNKIISYFGKNFFNENVLNAEKWTSASAYLSYFFIMLTIISIIILMISSIKKHTLLILMLSIFFIAIISIVIVGLSPTIYSSELRIDYVFEVCIVMLCMFLIDYLYQIRIEKRNINSQNKEINIKI